MTESEWLASDDPARMLSFLVGDGAQYAATQEYGRHSVATDRKLRLFAVACCRSVWHLLTDKKCRAALEEAELAADDDRRLEVAWLDWRDGTRDVPRWISEMSPCASNPTEAARLALTSAPSSPNAVAQSGLLREIIGNPFRPVTLPRPDCMECGNQRRLQTGQFPCPYCPCPWLTPTVLSLARAAYEERGSTCQRCKGAGHLKAPRPISNPSCLACNGTGKIEGGTLDPVRLAVLADALEEGGCAGESMCRECGGEGRRLPPPSVWAGAQGVLACGVCDGVGTVAVHPLLAHLRDPGPHVRGCRALDLILGRD